MSLAVAEETSKTVVTTVFFALVLDLLAFTIPLPLFPRLIAWYLHRESHESSTVLSYLLSLAHLWRATLRVDHTAKQIGQETRWLWSGGRERDGKNWDVVLLGGAMGSLFSFCQCIISPWLGRLSDRYGRKRILLATMLGNIISAAIWMLSTSFTTFVYSRLIAGLSEGNVQLSTAIISDVTSEATRSKSLALIGIAFSVCFTLGPSLGAYFASRPLTLSITPDQDRWNVYATPAAISLILLVVESVYLVLRLPETRHWRKENQTASIERKGPARMSPGIRLERLKRAGWIHGIFLLFFSGAEFTLTFLTYDLFAASNAQNGRLLSYIGILSATLQARHVRPSLARIGELHTAYRGVCAAVIAFALLSSLSLSAVVIDPNLSTAVLYLAATALAYTSATVVTGLTAAAAGYCDTEGVETVAGLQRGRALGGFRSKGQLGRAIGPVLASSIYWLRGPMTCYGIISVCLCGLIMQMRGEVRRESEQKRKLAKSE